MTNQNRGFFSKLFDFSFSSFVAPQIVGVLYILGLISFALIALSAIFTVLRFSGGAGLIAAVSYIFGFFVYAIGLRVFLESIVAQIRTAENTRILAEDILNRASNANLNS